jgi:hypothetical protein
VERARISSDVAYGPGRPIRIEVPQDQSAAALGVLQGFTPNVRTESAAGSTFFEIPNPEGLSAEDHPFSRELLPALDVAGVTVLSAIL